MLTETEKEKIRLEEEYRFEIRSQLQEARKERAFKSKVWSFLNSGFGLWLLAAVLITGAGSLYTQYQHAREERLKDKELIERLDLEISYRLSQVLLHLFELSNGNFDDPKLGEGRSPDEVKQTMTLLNAQPGGNSTSLYPEFSSLGLPALMAELRRHLKDEKERQQVDKTLLSLTGQAWRHSDYSDVKLMAKVINNLLLLPRWKRSSFYFIRCPAEKPLC